MRELNFYGDLSQYESQWRAVPKEEQVTIMPREEKVVVRYIHPDFLDLEPELTRFHESGELGRFEVLHPMYQSISPDLHFTRTIRLSHPLFPEYHFRVNAGVISQAYDGSFIIEPPDVHQTVFTRTEVPPLSMSNWKILPDGTEISIKSDQPLGAYSERQSRKKLNKTLKVREIVGDRFQVVTPLFEAVVSNRQQEHYGVFDYALPSDALGFKFIFWYDQAFIHPQLFTDIEGLSAIDQWHCVEAATSYSAAIYDSFYALGLIHLQNSVYHQFHRGNLYFGHKNGFPFKELILSDCETLGDISALSRYPINGNESPYYQSLWKDVIHPLMRNTRVKDPVDPILSIPHIVNAMSGYITGRGKDADQDSLYTQFCQSYVDTVGNDWIDDWNLYNHPLCTPAFKTWFRTHHNKGIKLFIEEWKQTSGLFSE